MARRGREAALKRAREKSRKDKQEAKREKRLSSHDSDQDAESVNESELLEEFARLSERHDNGGMSHQEYQNERQRILTELGIESDNL